MNIFKDIEKRRIEELMYVKIKESLKLNLDKAGLDGKNLDYESKIKFIKLSLLDLGLIEPEKLIGYNVNSLVYNSDKLDISFCVQFDKDKILLKRDWYDLISESYHCDLCKHKDYIEISLSYSIDNIINTIVSEFIYIISNCNSYKI
jgi:hypothetical protein